MAESPGAERTPGHPAAADEAALAEAGVGFAVFFETGDKARAFGDGSDAVASAAVIAKADDGTAGDDDPGPRVGRDGGRIDRRTRAEPAPVGVARRQQPEVGFDDAPLPEGGIESAVWQEANNPHRARLEHSAATVQRRARVFAFGEEGLAEDQEPPERVEGKVGDDEPIARGTGQGRGRTDAAEGFASGPDALPGPYA